MTWEAFMAFFQKYFQSYSCGILSDMNIGCDGKCILNNSALIKHVILIEEYKMAID